MYPNSIEKQEKYLNKRLISNKKPFSQRFSPQHKRWEGWKELAPQLPAHLHNKLSWYLKTLSGAHQRVLAILIKNADASGELKLSHAYIGHASNLSVAHVKRMLNDLRNRKLIDWRTFHKQVCTYKLVQELMLPKYLKQLTQPYTFFEKKQVKIKNELLNICISFIKNKKKEYKGPSLLKFLQNNVKVRAVSSVASCQLPSSPFPTKKETLMNKQSIIAKYNFSPDQLERLESISFEACLAAQKKMDWKKEKGKVIGSGEALFMIIATEENGKLPSKTTKAAATGKTTSYNKPSPYGIAQDYSLQRIEKDLISARKRMDFSINHRPTWMTDREVVIIRDRYEAYQKAFEIKKAQE